MVNTTTTPATAPLGNTPNTPTITRLKIQRSYTAPGQAANRLKLAPVDNTLSRQQAIENALSTALYHVRHGSGPLSIQAATGRAIRAASMLKQACAELTATGVAA
jgi:hypothetical protein